MVDLFSGLKGKGSGYQARCYFDASGKADWTATATSSTGVALFYNTAPDDKYTMVTTKSGHTFEAYDEPWKSANGDWEGNFGLWDSSMNIKPNISTVLGISQ